MSATRFSITAALGKGWQAFKAKPGTGILIPIAYGLASVLGSLPTDWGSSESTLTNGEMVLLIPMVILYVALGAGLVWNGLSGASGNGLRASRILTFERALPMVGALILSSAAIFAGLLLLVIPGLIIGSRLSLTPYFIADRGLGVMAALAASWEATRGNVMRLIGFNLLHYPAMLVGMLTLGLGFLVWPAVYWVAMADIYRQLTSGSDGQTIPGSSVRLAKS